MDDTPIIINEDNVIDLAKTKTLIFYLRNLYEEKEVIINSNNLLKISIENLEDSIEKFSGLEITDNIQKLLLDLQNKLSDTLIKYEVDIKKYMAIESKIKEITLIIMKRSNKNDEDGMKITNPANAFDNIKSELNKNQQDFKNDLIRFQNTEVIQLSNEDKETFIKEKEDFKRKSRGIIQEEIDRLKQVSKEEENNTSILDQKRVKINKLTDLLNGFDEAIEKHNVLLGVSGNPILSVYDEAIRRKKEVIADEEIFFGASKDILQQIRDSLPEYKKEELLKEIRNKVGDKNGMPEIQEMIDSQISELEKDWDLMINEEEQINSIGDDASKQKLAKRKQELYSDIGFVKSMKNSLATEGRSGILNIINENSLLQDKRIVSDEDKEKIMFSAIYEILNGKDKIEAIKSVQSFIDSNKLYDKIELKDLMVELSGFKEDPSEKMAMRIYDLGIAEIRKRIRSTDLTDIRTAFDDWQVKIHLQEKLAEKESNALKFSAILLDIDDVTSSILIKQEEQRKENDPAKKVEINLELKKLISKKTSLTNKINKDNIFIDDSKNSLSLLQEEIKKTELGINTLSAKSNLDIEESAMLSNLKNSASTLGQEIENIKRFIEDPTSVDKGSRGAIMTTLNSIILDPLKNEIELKEKTTRGNAGIKVGIIKEIEDLQSLVDSREIKMIELNKLSIDISEIEIEKDKINNILITSSDENEKKEAKKAMRRLEKELLKKKEGFNELELKTPSISKIKQRIDAIASSFGVDKSSLEGLIAIENALDDGYAVDKTLYQKDLENRFLKEKENEFVGKYVLSGDELKKNDISSVISISEIKNQESDIVFSSGKDFLKELVEYERLNQEGLLSTKQRNNMNLLTADTYIYDIQGNKMKRGGAILFAERGLGISEEGEMKEMVVEINGKRVKQMMKWVTMEDGRQGYVLNDVINKGLPSAIEILDQKIEGATLKTLDFYRSDNKSDMLRNITMNYKGGGAIGVLSAFIAIFFRMSDLFSYISEQIQNFFDTALEWLRKNMIQTFLGIFTVLMIGMIILISQDGSNAILFKNTINPGLFTTIRIADVATAINDINITLGTETVKNSFFFGFNMINGAFSLFLGGITYAILLLIVIEILKFVGQIHEKEIIRDGSGSLVNKSDDQKTVAKVKIVVYVIILLSLIFVNRFLFVSG